METKFTCPTNDCSKCIHLPYCTKEESDYVPSDADIPVLCPECGSFLLGELADGTGSVCLICYHVIEYGKIIKVISIKEVEK